MRTAKTVSITLPPDLLVKAQEIAQREHRTMSELFREALRHYLQGDAEWQALLSRTHAQGRAQGIKSEADTERLADDDRRDAQRPPQHPSQPRSPEIVHAGDLGGTAR